MTQPLNIAIAKQTIRVGSNGIENRFTLRITKSEPGQKISQLSLESYGGYQGLIKDSLKFNSKYLNYRRGCRRGTEMGWQSGTSFVI